jgi:uncharacterized iron-regulated membrane protein
MRGGALPLLAWGTLLLVLFSINWIWEGRLIQVGTTTFAILIVYGSALALWWRRREAIQPGPPPAEIAPEALPSASAGAVIVGLAVACVLFGLVWAQFLVFFGLGMLALGLGRVTLERRDQRRARARTLADGTR